MLSQQLLKKRPRVSATNSWILTHFNLYCKRTVSSLDQIMACCLIGTKPLTEPMLTHYEFDFSEQTLVRFDSKFEFCERYDLLIHRHTCIFIVHVMEPCLLKTWSLWYIHAQYHDTHLIKIMGWHEKIGACIRITQIWNLCCELFR